jgi:hypothetical protein
VIDEATRRRVASSGVFCRGTVRICHDLAPLKASGGRDYPGRVLDLDWLDLEEIATALADQDDYEHRWLIDPQTGEIAFWTADTGIDGQASVETSAPGDGWRELSGATVPSAGSGTSCMRYTRTCCRPGMPSGISARSAAPSNGSAATRSSTTAHRPAFSLAPQTRICLDRWPPGGPGP